MSALSFAAAARNPILSRELVTLLRSRKAFALLACYLLASVGVVLAAWPAEGAAAVRQGLVARRVFETFAAGQSWLLALILPAVLGAALTSEKEEGTHDLLLTTPLSADQILGGKLLSGTAFLGLLAASALPAVLLCSLLGGVGRAEIGGLYAVLLAEVALFGLTSLLLSCALHRTHTAVIASYVVVAAEAWALSGGRGPALAPLAVALSVALYLAARPLVRRPHQPARRAHEEEDAKKTVGLVMNRDVYPDRLIAPARRTTPMEDGMNPVLEKELQAGVYGSGSLFVRAVLQLGAAASVVVLLAAVARFASSARATRIEMPYLCFIAAYVAVLGPSLSARAFTSEREERTLEQLVLTLVPRARIVAGKFLAIARATGALALINCLSYAPLLLYSSSAAGALVSLALVLASTTALATALGLFLSLACRTTLAAMVTTYAALVALYAGPVVLSPLVPVLLPEEARRAAAAALTVASPLLAAQASEGAGPGPIPALAAHAALSALAAAALIAIMSVRFERTVLRESEGGT